MVKTRKEVATIIKVPGTAAVGQQCSGAHSESVRRVPGCVIKKVVTRDRRKTGSDPDWESGRTGEESDRRRFQSSCNQSDDLGYLAMDTACDAPEEPRSSYRDKS